MVYDYTAFFSSVYLSTDRIEIKINDSFTVEHLLDAEKEFKKTNIFDDDFHGISYKWRKYKFKQGQFFLITPNEVGTYYKPRLILTQPTLELENKIMSILSFQKGLYYRVCQLEITLDFVFKDEGSSHYAEDLKRQIEANTYIIWSRNSKTFDYKDTTYRMNSDKEHIIECTKPLRIYPKFVRNKNVLRFELMLNNTAAQKLHIPFILRKDIIFDYIRFYKNTFNAREVAKLIERMGKKGVDVVKLKRSILKCLTTQKTNINQKILRLKNIVKEHLPDYKGSKSISNCLVEDTELNAFILNNLYIKGI